MLTAFYSRERCLLHIEGGKAPSLDDAVEQDGLQLRVGERPIGAAAVETEL